MGGVLVAAVCWLMAHVTALGGVNRRIFRSCALGSAYLAGRSFSCFHLIGAGKHLTRRETDIAQGYITFLTVVVV